MATLGDVHSTIQGQIQAAVAGVLTGGGATATIGGTPHTGDVCSIIFTSTSITGSPVTISYTVQSGDTVDSIAAALTTAIGASSPLRSVGLTATVSAAVITINAPTLADIAYSQSVTGSATETIAIVDGLSPSVAVGWPPVNTLQSVVAQNGQAVVAVYDRKLVMNATRWMPYIIQDVVATSTLTSEISNAVIKPLASQTITLGATVTSGDAVSCVLTNVGVVPQEAWAEVAVGVSSDTPTTLATALASQINADETLNVWVTASAVGPVVTLTSVLTKGNLVLQSFTGNGGTRTMEIARRKRELTVVVWAQTEEDRQSVGDPIEAILHTLYWQFGVTFSDGTLGRLIPAADYYLEDDTLQDVYRRDFMFTLDYPITTTDALYSVLAPVQQYSLN